MNHAYPAGTPGADIVTFRHIDELDGIWVIRFGAFGWRDEDLRGGVLRLVDGDIFGGSSNFLFRGGYSFSENEVRGHLQVDRHGADPTVTTIYGDAATGFSMTFIAHPISSDRLEGYFRRVGHPDARVVFIRYRDDEAAPHLV